ncbi:DegT/DnrJ/EryC1/StrS family aminotransferase, partial [Lysinibacillus sp. D4B1_S16]
LCPNAEKWYEKHLTLPIHPNMTVEELSIIVSNIKELLK